MHSGDECWFVGRLIDWWIRTGGSRHYPWRNTGDPYRVLVAEVLLQRTRRDKVREVYVSFIERFPDPRTLAEADVREVEEAIRGLGLRKRAPYLIRLAHAMAEKYGELTADGNFEELPGIGRYMASAARIILGMDTELYPDSSIARVFSRLFGRKLEARRPADTPWVAEILNRCSPKSIDLKKKYFLALIDLAWEICRPNKARCDICPIRDGCTYASGSVKP